MKTIKKEFVDANGQINAVEFNVDKGTKFIDGNGIVHTIEEINDSFVIHSYNDCGRKVTDGYMYRNVFDKLLCQMVFNLID